MTSDRPRRMIGYLRVSQRMGRQGPGYISPDVQRESIQRWADYRHVEIIDYVLDEDQSGRTQDRPGLRRCMDLVESGQVDGIACWRLNRFARNVSQALEDVKRLQAAGGSLACVEEDVDPTGPFGSFILTILLAVAALEVENLTAGWRDARERAAARGVMMGPAPLGYRHGGHGVLEIDPATAPIVQRAYRLAADEGIHAARDHLEAALPDRCWRISHLRAFLARTTYRGDLVHDGESQSFTASCPALVDRSTWTRAQTKGTPRRPRKDYALSGLARCGTCGHAMHGNRSTVPTYRCGNESSCDARASVSVHLLDRHVTDALGALLGDVTLEVAQDTAGTVEALERALEDAEREVQEFAADPLARKVLTGPGWRDALQARVDVRDQARDALDQALQRARPLQRVPANLDDVEPLELRRLADAVLREIRVARGRAKIYDRVTLVPHDPDRGPAVSG